MLNLLPPQQKTELRLNLLSQSIIVIAATIIFMILIFALLIFLGQFFLKVNLEETQQELNLWRSRAEIKELSNLEHNINELNKNLLFLDSRQKERISFYSILENLAQDTPAGIRPENLSIKSSSEVAFRGFAINRDVLLVLKNNLEKAPYVKNFNFPLSNLTQATNINFFLSFVYSP